MYKIAFLFFPILLLFACNTPDANSEDTAATKVIEYPEAMQKIFARHGGLEQWQKMKTLSYEMVDTLGNEKQLVDLKNRRERIEGRNFTTGFDGTNYWIEADTSYKGNPVFYHNLMFYFYAMPFVLADEGIIYTPADTLHFEGENYPGIKITYKAGVGVSSQDEYFIHYDPQTYQMAWLGYTVTYFSKEKSEKIKWIRYDNWHTINALLLPKSMTWYLWENGHLTQAQKTRTFDKITLSESAPEDVVFEKTPNAIIVEE